MKSLPRVDFNPELSKHLNYINELNTSLERIKYMGKSCVKVQVIDCSIYPIRLFAVNKLKVPLLRMDGEKTVTVAGLPKN